MAEKKKKSGGRKYGPKAAQKVKKAMHERKRGTLRSGRSGKKVTSRKQAIAIGLSQARRAGGAGPVGAGGPGREGDQPQAGDRDRSLASAARRGQGSAAEEVFAAIVVAAAT